MPHVPAGLDVPAPEAGAQLRYRHRLNARPGNVAAEQHGPAGVHTEAHRTVFDGGGASFPARPVAHDGTAAGENGARVHCAKLLTAEALWPAAVQADPHRQSELQMNREAENNHKAVNLTNASTAAAQKRLPNEALFVDGKAADLAHNETNALKISNITKSTPGTLWRTSRVAKKVPHGLKVGVQHMKKKAQAPQRLAKYYFQRYRLFHRFDEGVVMDEVSWYSVTPEKIAKHIAERFGDRQLVVDLYSGAGGNSIQFALNGAYVIAVEMSASRIDIARNNARVYGVEEYIEFVAADVVDALLMMKERNLLVDGIFMSPPWGGPEYQEKDVFDVGVFKAIVELARTVSKNVGILVPRNVTHENVLQWFGPCEMEWNYLGNKAKTVTIYFGDLIRFPGLC